MKEITVLTAEEKINAANEAIAELNKKNETEFIAGYEKLVLETRLRIEATVEIGAGNIEVKYKLVSVK